MARDDHERVDHYKAQVRSMQDRRLIETFRFNGLTLVFLGTLLVFFRVSTRDIAGVVLGVLTAASGAAVIFSMFR